MWVQPWLRRIMPVPDRLARAAHAHREVEERHGGRGAGILVEHRLVAAHAGEVVDVAGLGQAHDGVDQQVRLRLPRGAEGQLLMRAVEGVAGLERDDLAPAELAEVGAQLVGRVAAGAEIVVHGRLDAGDRPAEIDRPGLVMQVGDGGVRAVVGRRTRGRPRATCPGSRGPWTERIARITPSGSRSAMSWPSSIFSAKAAETSSVIGHGPERAVGEPHLLDHAVVVGPPEETLERREPAVHQELDVADLPRS